MNDRPGAGTAPGRPRALEEETPVEILRVFNNNVVLARDPHHGEVILTGYSPTILLEGGSHMHQGHTL